MVKRSSLIEKNFSTVTTSTGVVIRCKKIPRLLIGELVKIPRPKPPVVFLEDLGREEENPNDPGYIDKLQQWEIGVSIGMVDAFIVFGTEVTSVPDGMIKSDNPSVKNKLRLLNVSVSNDDEVYLAWIKYFACPEDEDINALVEGVGRLSGVSEKDVNDALENKFRDNAGRSTNNGETSIRKG